MLSAGDQDEVEIPPPEDGQNYRPKYVELIEIINKTVIVASSRLFILLMHHMFIIFTKFVIQ